MNAAARSYSVSNDKILPVDISLYEYPTYTGGATPRRASDKTILATLYPVHKYDPAADAMMLNFEIDGRGYGFQEKYGKYTIGCSVKASPAIELQMKQLEDWWRGFARHIFASQPKQQQHSESFTFNPIAKKDYVYVAWPRRFSTNDKPAESETVDGMLPDDPRFRNTAYKFNATAELRIWARTELPDDDTKPRTTTFGVNFVLRHLEPMRVDL